MREELLETVRALPAGARLVYRLLRDDRVDGRAKAGVAAALAYAVLPIDLIPDRFSVLGRADDVLVAAAAIEVLLEAAGEDLVVEHWDGTEPGLEAVTGLMEALAGIVPRSVRRLLGARR